MTKSFPAPLAARRPRGLHALVLAIGLVLAGGALDAEARDKEKDKDKEKDHGKVTVALNISAPTPAVAPAALELTAAAESAQSSHPVERVEYYQGATLIGSASTAPYRVSWHSVPAGSYTLTARAINDKGDTATSAPQPVRIDAPPTVALTAPAASTVLTAPGSVTLAANAADSDGTIQKVDFYQGGMLIGSTTAAPYAFPWTNVPAGTYTLTAQATDNNGAVTTSAAIPVKVNALPAVALTAPAANSVVNAPGTLAITANATDSDGTIAKVDFYQGSTLLGTATAAPYTFIWTNAPAGSYTLAARATDNDGGVATSAPVSVTVNALPAVAFTSPIANAVLSAPATVTLAANATDSDGSIQKVEFYQGGTLLGTATSAPYAFTWGNVPAGSYTLTARATDNSGAVTMSAPLAITVDVPPTVAITSPVANAIFNAPATVTIAATAADTDGTIAKVDFYQGGTLLGTATTAPYAFIWTNVPAGTYTLTAQATDNNGAVTTSAAIPVSVNAPPTVSLTSPTNKQILLAPASVTITATATDSDGTIQKVDFYQGGTLLGTATAAPYAFTWTNVPAGNYTLTAQATDNNGGTATSSPVTVILDAPPSIALASPANNQRFTAPATIALTATATDTDGSIAKVDFYQGTTLLGTATMAPYTYTWANVGEGNYTLMAKATDNGGAETYSAQIAITVQSSGPKLYYLHTDHLDTPRAVTDETNKIIWRNLPLTEPFGMSPPEEDPDGDGISFTMNLRFPGQYFDRETNLNYNYFRDYDPNTGRYIQSDPIGLKGGINTYSYVGGNPVSYSDSLGLDPTINLPTTQTGAPINITIVQQQNSSAQSQTIGQIVTGATKSACRVVTSWLPTSPPPEPCNSAPAATTCVSSYGPIR